MQTLPTDTLNDFPLLVINESGQPSLPHDGSPPEVMRERIDALAASMLSKFGGCDLPVEHAIADGMYLRKLHIPAGTLLVGKIHLKACHNIVAKGDISVLTELGAARLQAGATAPSGRGIQKVGYAHEDTIFINVFRTDEVDIESIEAEIASEVHVPLEVVWTGNFATAVERDRADYAAFLVEYGLTEPQVRAIVEDMSDHAPMPEGWDMPAIKDSPIQGRGMFAAHDHDDSEAVTVAREDGRRTLPGRMVNHSARPNCRMRRLRSHRLLLVALRRITAGEELTLDYRQAASVNTESGLVPIKGEI